MASRLRQVETAVIDFMLQGRGKLIDVTGCDVDRSAVFEKRHAIAANGVAPDLQQEP